MMRHAIGIDLGGTSVKYAVVAADGEMRFGGELPTRADEGAERVLKQLAQGVAACRDYVAREGIELEGVGIGTPGIVSEEGRTVLGGAENIVGWENVPLADRIEAAAGMPCRACNDANAMALGESLFGAGRGVTDAVFVTVGTGIGCGMLMGGRLYRGYRGRGMELGHITVKCDGEPCACGGRGCLEHYASTAALVRRYAQLAGGGSADGRTIVARYHAGETTAVRAMEEHWMYLSHGIASVINLFAPQRIVVGGGISEAGDFYFERLREGVRRQAMGVCAAGCEIVPAALGNRAGALGAAGLVLGAGEK